MVDPDEVTHYESPHLDLRCFQIQHFSFLALEVFCDLIKILA